MCHEVISSYEFDDLFDVVDMDKALEDFLNDISVKIMQLFKDSSGRQLLIILLGFNFVFFVGKLIAFDGFESERLILLRQAWPLAFQ